MNIKMVPVPPDALEATAGTWVPFVEKVAARTKDHASTLINQVMAGEIGILLAWDAETKKALALAGFRILKRGHGRIGELLWMTGESRELWQDLIDEVELYFMDHQNCVGLKAICRPGWARVLKARDYKITHYVIEKEF